MISTGQSVRIKLDTGQDLSGVTDTYINYEKPNGNSGQWPASVSGSNLEYITNNDDLDISGVWKLQAFYKEDGNNRLGRIVKLTIENAL